MLRQEFGLGSFANPGAPSKISRHGFLSFGTAAHFAEGPSSHAMRSFLMDAFIPSNLPKGACLAVTAVTLGKKAEPPRVGRLGLDRSGFSGLPGCPVFGSVASASFGRAPPYSLIVGLIGWRFLIKLGQQQFRRWRRRYRAFEYDLLRAQFFPI